MRHSQEGFVWLPVLLVIGLIVVGGGAYFVMHQNASSQIPPNSPNVLPTIQTIHNTQANYHNANIYKKSDNGSPAKTGTQESGAFVSTYLPGGWIIKENQPFAMRVESPDFMLENPATVPDCSGATNDGCAVNAGEQVLGKGAYFDISFYPCLSGGETVSDFRKRLANMHAGSEQTPITVGGHDATVFHSRSLTDTTHPMTKNDYEFFVIVSATDCQDVQFGAVESTTTDYKAEFQKFVNGLQFIIGKSAR